MRTKSKAKKNNLVEDAIIDEFIDASTVENPLEETAKETPVEETAKEKKKKEELSDYEILDSSEAKGQHKKRGPKKKTDKKIEPDTEKEEDNPFTKEEMFEKFIDFIELVNGVITSFITGKEPERYQFSPTAKMFLYFVASKQKRFFVNLEFMRQTWFFLAAMAGVLIATHVQVILVDREDKKKEKEKAESENSETIQL